MKLGNKDLTDPKSIVEQFCKYFSNIGHSLANNISAASVSHRFVLSGNFLESLFLDSVSEQEVIEICKSLKPGTAVGYDNVSVDLVKQCAQLINSPLTHIINMSIVSGIVQDELKIARVIPLFKSKDRLCLLTIDLWLCYRLFCVLHHRLVKKCFSLQDVIVRTKI